MLLLARRVGWSPGMATVVSQVGQGHYYIDYGGRIFKQSAEQLSHVTERKTLGTGGGA